MADEPSPGELSRRIDHVTTSLAGFVQRTEYSADRRYDDRRFAEIETDVAELRRQFTDELKALRESIDAATEKRSSNQRQLVYAALVPAVLVMVSTVVQIWLAMRGP